MTKPLPLIDNNNNEKKRQKSGKNYKNQKNTGKLNKQILLHNAPLKKNNFLFLIIFLLNDIIDINEILNKSNRCPF